MIEEAYLPYVRLPACPPACASVYIPKLHQRRVNQNCHADGLQLLFICVYIINKSQVAERTMRGRKTKEAFDVQYHIHL